MFWKKKRPVTDKIIHESEDKRNTYRYEFKDGQGIQIEFLEKKVTVINISSGGMAFKNRGFKKYDFDFIKFKLSIPDFKGKSTFFAGLRVLTISQKETCHCIFEHCSLDQHELIHRYVLEMQKYDLAH